MKKIALILLSLLISVPISVMPVFAATLTPQPVAVPTNLTATLNLNNKVNLSWTGPINNVGVSGYMIMRDNSLFAKTSDISLLDTSVAPSTAYSYTVSAFDVAGNISASSSAVSITTPAATATSTPSMPLSLVASASSSSEIDLSWSNSTSTAAIAGYNIFRDGLFIGNSTTNSFSDVGLMPSASHNYTINAFDVAGNVSAMSASASATTLASSDTITPSIPTGLTANLNSSNQVMLSWIASTDNVAVTGYSIMRNGSMLSNSTSTNFVDTSVVASTTYTYSVLAFDAAGNKSAVSNSVSITTSATSPNPGNGNGNENRNHQGDMEKYHQGSGNHQGDMNNHGNNGGSTGSNDHGQGASHGNMNNHENRGSASSNQSNASSHNDNASNSGRQFNQSVSGQASSHSESHHSSNND